MPEFGNTRRLTTVVSGIRLGRAIKDDQIDINRLLGKKSEPAQPVVYKTANPAYASTIRGVLAQAHNLDKVYLFQFNPTEISDTKDAPYEGIDRPGMQYTNEIWPGGGERTISFKLFMDATAGSVSPNLLVGGSYGSNAQEILRETKPRGVLDDVEFIRSFLYPELPEATAPRFVYGGAVPPNQFSAPPTAVLVYGELYLEGVIKRADVNYQLWDADLVPRRCEMEIVFSVHEQVQVKPNKRLQGQRAK